MRALGGGHERAIDRKRRDRLTAAGKETSDALAEWQVGAGALDRDHEDAGGLMGQRDTRAGAGERASMPAPIRAGERAAVGLPSPRSAQYARSEPPQARAHRTGAIGSLPPSPRRTRRRRPHSPTRCGWHPRSTARRAARRSPAAPIDCRANATVPIRMRSFRGCPSFRRKHRRHQHLGKSLRAAACTRPSSMRRGACSYPG